MIRTYLKPKGIKIFYAKHNKLIEDEINQWLKVVKPTTISTIAKIRIDNENKPHFVVIFLVGDENEQG